VEAGQLQQQSLAMVEAAKAVPHARYPQLWSRWCESMGKAFHEGRTLRPLTWKQPEKVGAMLGIVRRLTERDWPPGISIRLVGSEVVQDSKMLEDSQGFVEACLTSLFGNVTSLQSLGITGSASHVWAGGPMVLHFENGSELDHASSQGRYSIDHVDLVRAREITTTALRLLTVENLKATFRDLVAANVDRSTLIVFSSFPSEAMKLLLAKLPAGLPHYHFGDTDPSGWHILLKLREASPRPVLPLHMRWRAGRKASPLTEHDKKVLPMLLASPLMSDCRQELQMMIDKADRGDFEQESFGMPGVNWPFY